MKIVKKMVSSESENIPIPITKNDIKEMVCEVVRCIIEGNGNQFNIKNVYHVSDTVFDEFKSSHFSYYFFSSKPIAINGSKVIYTCNLSMQKPFVFNEAPVWSYPLWLFLSDKDGHLIPEEEFTPEKYDGYLGCPYEFWKMVYYDEDEYEVDQIPELVRALNMGYDGVIITNVQEGNTGIFVDDYIVFSPKQIQIVRKTLN